MILLHLRQIWRYYLIFAKVAYCSFIHCLNAVELRQENPIHFFYNYTQVISRNIQWKKAHTVRIWWHNSCRCHREKINCTCAFCDGVTRQHMAVLDSMANSVNSFLQCLSAISSAQPSITKATSYINRKKEIIIEKWTLSSSFFLK